ncbi:hypothetical protein O181_103732 [Austropuccinia psidii MF-1]|uniref:Tet-like 2OG-Fe(II) oxygenase domain-containing protein n=1 Tax=Austropuccinia psidii MF-1 TaxID=1389203 RepID=A0A9Q3JLQ3_9BASI|nr:hypothetical protein [Austropuccinia psidii MF-1]
MNGFKNPLHVNKDALLYALGWWFQADWRTGKIQKDVLKRCTGGKLIFTNDHLCIELSKHHGLIRVVWASSTFFHYTDPEQDNKSTTLVALSAQCSEKLAKARWQESHCYYKIDEGAAIRSGIVIQSHPISKNEGIWRRVGIRGLLNNNSVVLPSTLCTRIG